MTGNSEVIVRRRVMSERMWGLLCRCFRHFGTTCNISEQLNTAIKSLPKQADAGFLACFELVAKSGRNAFQDRPFRPLTHPSAFTLNSLAADTANGTDGLRKHFTRERSGATSIGISELAPIQIHSMPLCGDFCGMRFAAGRWHAPSPILDFGPSRVVSANATSSASHS
jgi:hypothetical protein